MKLGVIGSRLFEDYGMMEQVLDEFCAKNHVTHIVSGGCEGADRWAEHYARQNKIEPIVHPPEKGLDGKIPKYAYAVRNRLIVKDSDYIIAFWDGKEEHSGTMMTVEMANKAGVKNKVYQFDPNVKPKEKARHKYEDAQIESVGEQTHWWDVPERRQPKLYFEEEEESCDGVK